MTTPAIETDRAACARDARSSADVAQRDRFVLVAVPLGAILLVAPRYRSNWYFYDEFSMLQRVLGMPTLRAAFEPFNGHLYLVAYVAYRVQVAFGLHGHAIVWFVFCSTLLGCNLAVGLSLHAARVPALPAALAGVLVTYFGPGAQLMTLEFQLGMVGAIAASFFAAWVVLSRSPSPGSALTVCALLLLAVAFDSGTATAGFVFVAVLLLRRWRVSPATVVAIAPALAAAGVYLLVKGSGPRWRAGLGTEMKFGVHLVAAAAGGLVGGGQVAGVVLLVVSALVVVPALRAGRIAREAVDCLAAGTATVVGMTLLLSVTRAGLVRNDFVKYNRYVALVAFFVLAALLPALVSVATNRLVRPATWVAPVTAAVLAFAFVLNLGPLTRYRRTVEGWQQQTHALTLQAQHQLRLGCADGKPPAATALPLGTLGPQVTVALLRELDRRDLLRPHPVAVSPSVRAAICSRSHV